MRATVTPVEAMQQLARLMAVFPRHGLSDSGAVEYADSLTTLFAGEWHMRAVVNEAKRRFDFFPTVAQLSRLADEVSAARRSVVGCRTCIPGHPGFAYTRALWTPGSHGKLGTLEPLTSEGFEAVAPGIEAAKQAARQRGETSGGQDVFDLPFVEIEENGKRLTVLNARSKSAGVVGYCGCEAGVELRRMRLARIAEEADRRTPRSGGLRKAS